MTKLKTIHELIGGELVGDPELAIESVNTLYDAGPKEIAFSISADIDPGKISAGALILRHGNPVKYKNKIFVDEPYLAFAALLNYFFPASRFSEGIASSSHVEESARLGEKVSIGPFSYVGARSRIGTNTEIHANVTIYPDVTIGKNCLIYSNVVIREEVEVGDDTIIHPGVVIGSDGFGFTRLSDGTPVKIPQKGRVRIGKNCEIGANTCIDRSTIAGTILEDHVKTDNLVQIGHNVTIGRHTSLSAQTGISGSTRIGENVVAGGQVGFADHITIADGVMLAGKTGVIGSIKEKCIVAGYPHQDIRKWRKSQVLIRNLESMADRIKSLENRIKKMEENK